VTHALTVLQTRVAEHHGLASLLSDRALTAAGRADLTLATAESGNPLLGIPFAVKDAFAASGAPTTWGSPYFRDQRFAYDADMVARLESTGGVLTAKLALSELAGYGGPTAAGSSLQGNAANPWDPNCYAGGSSGGSAIAVALDAVPYALGTETAGSVVGPAALCGVTGFRPTPGRLPRNGMLTLSRTLDKVGIIARTARDCAIVFAATAKAATNGAVLTTSIRIGYVTDESDDWAGGAATTLSRARAEFAEIGSVVPIRREDLGEAGPALQSIMVAEAAFTLRETLADERFQLLDAGQTAGLRSGANVSADEYIGALAVRGNLQRRFRQFFESCDVIVTASRPDTARPLGSPRGSTRSAADLLRATANLIGLPGVTVPCGLSSGGMPLGLHVVGPRGADEYVLGLAAGYQARTLHHTLRPTGAVKASSGATA
jgi:aspartyl-tRNA(Asn)/glutamyl-tRNA(Gln) amidotransferase subunit A